MTRDYHNLLQETEGEHTKTFLWDGFAAGMIEEGQTEQTYFYLHDELGSPVRLTDQQGSVAEGYGYDEFGTDTHKSRGLQPFGYTGYQRDEVAGTYYAQAREYLPADGRFAGTDQIKGSQSLPQSLNEYSYCWNSPLCYVDPNGLWIHIAVGAAVGAVVNTAVTVGTSLAKGEKITAKKIFASAVGGAVTGGITAANPAATVGAAGAVVESLINDVGTKPPKEVIKNAAVSGATSAAFSWAGGKIGGSKLASKAKNSKAVTAVKNSKAVTSVKNSKIATSFNQIKKKATKQVNEYNRRYKSSMSRARNAWNSDRKVIKRPHKTVRNGILAQPSD